MVPSACHPSAIHARGAAASRAFLGLGEFRVAPPEALQLLLMIHLRGLQGLPQGREVDVMDLMQRYLYIILHLHTSTSLCQIATSIRTNQVFRKKKGLKML